MAINLYDSQLSRYYEEAVMDYQRSYNRYPTRISPPPDIRQDPLKKEEIFNSLLLLED